MSMDLVAVIVPVWNEAAQAVECLTHLAKVASPRLLVIVVDNGSEPEEGRVLEDCCKRLGERFELLKFPTNLGFAAGVNAGMERGFARGAQAALLLNSDAIVAENAIELLYSVSQARPRIGIVGPRVLDPKRRGDEVSCGERVSLWLLPLPRRLLRHRPAPAELVLASGVLGCAMMITGACYSAIGPLDERFFAYYEEVEYCLRARARGFSIAVVPRALVWHEPGRGFGGGFSPLSAYLKSRNLLLLMAARGSWYHWPLFLVSYGLMLAASGLFYALRGERAIIAAIARGVAHGIAGQGGPPPETLGFRATAARHNGVTPPGGKPG